VKPVRGTNAVAPRLRPLATLSGYSCATALAPSFRSLVRTSTTRPIACHKTLGLSLSHSFSLSLSLSLSLSHALSRSLALSLSSWDLARVSTKDIEGEGESARAYSRLWGSRSERRQDGGRHTRGTKYYADFRSRFRCPVSRERERERERDMPRYAP
jgi:hypothetical protein